MVSEFRRKKLLHVFNSFFDHDKSGSVDQNDFKQMAISLAKARGYNESDVLNSQRQEVLNKIWQGLVAQADSDGDGVVNADEFIKVWDDYAKNPAAAPEWQKIYAKAVFRFIDIARDGSIDADEFSKVNVAFGLDPEKSKEAFAKMAKGKDKLSLEEFQVLFDEYFTSENPADAGNYVFGIKPL